MFKLAYSLITKVVIGQKSQIALFFGARRGVPQKSSVTLPLPESSSMYEIRPPNARIKTLKSHAVLFLNTIELHTLYIPYIRTYITPNINADMKRLKMRFYNVEDDEDRNTEQGKGSGLRCLFNCLPRTRPSAKFRNANMANNQEPIAGGGDGGDGSLPLSHSTDEPDADHEELLKAYVQDVGCLEGDYWGYDSYNASSREASSREDDCFSLAPAVINTDCVDFTFRTTDKVKLLGLSVDDDDEAEDYSVGSNPQIGLSSAWVPFESFFLPSTPVRSKQHSRKSSQCTPTTTGTGSTLNDTVDNEDLNDFLVTVMTDHELGLPSFDDSDYEIDDDRSSDSSDSDTDSDTDSDLSDSDTNSHSSQINGESTSTSQHEHRRSASENTVIHGPPNPRRRTDIDNFLDDPNENTKQNENTGEGLSNYMSIFYPEEYLQERDDDDSSASDKEDDSFCSRISEYSEEEENRESLEDIGSRDHNFDSIYHSSLASI